MLTCNSEIIEINKKTLYSIFVTQYKTLELLQSTLSPMVKTTHNNGEDFGLTNPLHYVNTHSYDEFSPTRMYSTN